MAPLPPLDPLLRSASIFLAFYFYQVLEGEDNDTAVAADSDGVKEYLRPGDTGGEDPGTESPLTPAEITDAVLYATNKVTETQISEKSLQSRVATLESFHGIFWRLSNIYPTA